MWLLAAMLRLLISSKLPQLWAQHWEQSDVVIEGNPAAQQGIRFNIAQLFMMCYGKDKRLNIGPKGFTGEKYGGLLGY